MVGGPFRDGVMIKLLVETTKHIVVGAAATSFMGNKKLCVFFFHEICHFSFISCIYKPVNKIPKEKGSK